MNSILVKVYGCGNLPVPVYAGPDAGGDGSGGAKRMLSGAR